MKVSYELEQGYIDVWNEKSEEWDRYIKINKKSVVEEDKKIEKLKWNEKSQHNVVTDNTKKTLEHLLSRTEQLKKSINELIDEINKLNSKMN